MRLKLLLIILLASFVCRAQEPKRKRLTNVSDAYPVLSPDNTMVAFKSNRTGNWEIFTMNLDGTKLKQLTSNPLGNHNPVWSPDGKQIVFASERDGDSEIYIMNADGTNQKRLTHQSGDDSHPKFSPDGGLIIFNSERTSPKLDPKADWSKQWHELFTMKTDGTELKQLSSFKTVTTYPATSPDGRKIAFRKVDDTPGFNWDLSPSKRNSEVYVMNRDGSELTNISNSAAFDGWPCWSPDGKKVLFASNRNGPANMGQVFSVTLDGKDLVQLTKEPGGHVQPSISPDGKKLLAYEVWEDSESEFGAIASFDISLIP
jgi:TolB protein